ncbi:L-threonine aldolase [Arboricoccus pini]|uniref:L-threonine aldolase n=1 Tax=Arboricoccus pini TaxID=1963835 RepID=A0A212PZJ8_9PROT|nr:threonine aldolase family protein [Arboricoccus pini]SNB52450.1 L-threonine aldolase [Arboricoccus pini]
MQEPIDLFSDTRTKPTKAMREVMATALVGDEQVFEDPSVNELCARTADLLGKERAMFLPSGTMCNQIAIAVRCRLGEAVYLDCTAHPLTAEAGGPAALAGVILAALPGERGVFTGPQLEAALAGPNRNKPRARLVSVEQTSNFGGGRVWRLDELDAVCSVAAKAGVGTHMDGARLMNAVVASGVPAGRQVRDFDTCWLDFSKGLGAPVGAVLAGSADFIEEAWRFKQMLGGAMRQAGILAAACTYALDHHVERLAEDHENARRLADGLATIKGITLDPATIETNLVFFEIEGDAQSFVKALAKEGIRMGAMGARIVRAVTHLDIDKAGIDRAIAAAARVLA